MSKDGLPTLKDGELFGDVLKQPIVVRYHGVDTQTVEGAALVAARAGEVNRFVAKGRQAYSLSGRTHLTVRGQITDGDARYTNQFGNEIVDVRVNTPKPGARPVRPEPLWDYALIDMIVTADVDLYACAVLRVPGIGVIDGTTAIPHVGVASYYPTDGVPDRVINIARPGWAETSAGDNPGQIASWTVDMSNLGTVPIVQVDIYGSLYNYFNPGNYNLNYVITPSDTMDSTSAPGSYPGPGPVAPMSVPDPGDPEFDGGFEDFPGSPGPHFTVSFDTGSNIFVFDLTGTRFTGWQYSDSDYFGYVPDPGHLWGIDPSFVHAVYDYTGTVTSTPAHAVDDFIRPADYHGYDPSWATSYGVTDAYIAWRVHTMTPAGLTYSGDDPAAATLQATVFRNRQQFVVGEHASEFRWDPPAGVGRPTPVNLVGAAVGVFTGDPPNGHLLQPVLEGLRFVGTITIDRHNGGVSFKPA